VRLKSREKKEEKRIHMNPKLIRAREYLNSTDDASRHFRESALRATVAMILEYLEEAEA